jgi:hypothetical protein
VTELKFYYRKFTNTTPQKDDEKRNPAIFNKIYLLAVLFKSGIYFNYILEGKSLEEDQTLSSE